MNALSALPTQRRRWSLATAIFALTLGAAMQAQDYNNQPYPPQTYPQQQSYGQQPNDPSQGDPPAVVARVAMLQGNVSLQPAGVEDFSPASLNYPLTSGDRLYNDNGSVTELQAGQLAVRLGSATDFSVTTLTDQLAQFGLGQGSIHVRTYDLDPNATLEIDTPNVAVTVLAAGDLRVNVSPDGTMTQVTLLSGQARIDGPNFQQDMQPGESLQITGNEQIYAQDVRRPRSDDLDRFSSDRDSQYQAAIAAQSGYVSPDTIGAADLSGYGDWSSDGDNGPVWYPRGVSVDWQPYSFGHWAYIAPWGWTWVENEPWGFAPFHYGRWARFGPRWGWIPGPHVVRPIYSPALVAFVGGGGGGASFTAWFPLGPREPFVPWYRTSALYANRVNVTNIYSRNTVEIHNIYNQRTTNIYVNNTTINRVYVNRPAGTVAVPQAAFAGGRPVREAALHLPMRDLANAPVIGRPNASPTRAIMAPGPAHALPPRMNRPPVESRAPVNGGPGGWNRPGNNGGSFNNGSGQPWGGRRPGDNVNQGNDRNGNRPGNGGNQPSTQPTNGNQYPGRGNGSQPGQGNQYGNGNQYPGRGNGNQPGNGQGQQPNPSQGGGRGTTTNPGQPGEGRQGPPRSSEPIMIQPQPTRPGNSGNAPGNGGQYPGRGNGNQPGQGNGSGSGNQPGQGQQPGRGTTPMQPTNPIGSANMRPGQYTPLGPQGNNPGGNQPGNGNPFEDRDARRGNGNGSRPTQPTQQQPAQQQPSQMFPGRHLPMGAPDAGGQPQRTYQPQQPTPQPERIQPQQPVQPQRQWAQPSNPAPQQQNRMMPAPSAPMRIQPQPAPQPARPAPAPAPREEKKQ